MRKACAYYSSDKTQGCLLVVFPLHDRRLKGLGARHPSEVVNGTLHRSCADTCACRWVNYALQSVLKCEFMSKENKTKYLKCLILLWTPLLEGNEEFPAGSILVLVNYFGYLCSFLFLFSEFCWCNIKTCNTAAGAIKGSKGLTYNLLRAFFLDQPLRRPPPPTPTYTHTSDHPPHALIHT